MKRLVALLVTLLVAASAALPASALARRAPEAVVAAGFEGPVALELDTPVTLTLPPGSGEGRAVLELEFDSVTAGGDAAPFVRVFLGEQTEGGENAPGYVGAASFYPVPLTGPSRTVFPLDAAIERLGDAGTLPEGGVPVTVVLKTARDAPAAAPPPTARLSDAVLRRR